MAIAFSGGSTTYTSTFTASPAANRAVTVPDADFTMTGNDLTQTLTNKTLTNPSVNNYTEGVVAIGNTGTSQTLSLTAEHSKQRL